MCVRRTNPGAILQGATLRPMRRAAFLWGSILGVASLAAGSLVVARASSPEASARAPRAPEVDVRGFVCASAAVRQEEPMSAWAARLGALTVKNRNTEERAALRLYDPHGDVDPLAAATFMRIAEREHVSAAGASEHLDVRLLQLVARAAYHFGRVGCRGQLAACVGAASTVVIVSATRSASRGKHASGEALDFFLEGVRSATLAAYLRSFPRAGVGVYTHPRTQYVHLDVRERSFHWLDASPPGRTWRERALRDPKGVVRDAQWDLEDDLPEIAF